MKNEDLKEPRFLQKIRVVVPISGGKDSQSCLKLALQSYSADEVLGLFCDTQFEHPLTYQHIDTMRKLYGVKIERVCAGSVYNQCLKNGVFPASRLRFCTESLKQAPSRDFYRELAIKQGSGFQVWLGMRGQESRDRAKRYQDIIDTEIYPPNDVLDFYPKYLHEKHGVFFRLPVQNWTSQDVFEFLDGEENPLYSFGFERVGCFPCLASGKRYKRQAFNFDETGKKHQKMVAELAELGVVEDKRDKNMSLFSGCALCAM